MPSDYEAIAKDNVRRRGEEFDDIGNFLAEKLYADRAHFIYELLQNAEDALARRRQDRPGDSFSGDVSFDLHSDHLEVRHRGMPFDEADVRAISDVLRGTKAERTGQIGTFGIGFKSVYAFTRTPEVFSGDEHFALEHYIRPRGASPKGVREQDETLFHFPFDHPDLSAPAAFDLIRDKLKALGPRSLLFLSHIDSLRWSVEGSGSGLYMRGIDVGEDAASHVQIIGESDGVESVEEEWLVFTREVEQRLRSEKLQVKVAYRLGTKGNAKVVKGLRESLLHVYFPTRVETGLGFLVHGPFESTPARDNILSNSAWNDLLLTELAGLAAASLDACRRRGFLTPEFLSVLPLDREQFRSGSVGLPFFDAVREALSSQPLIPLAEGHARACELLLGRSQDLRDLLPPEALQQLLVRTPAVQGWVSPEISENRAREVWHYLHRECRVDLFDGETLAREIRPSFLSGRSDEWMGRFYRYLTGQPALWREKTWNYTEGPLRSKEFIRCIDGSHRRPFDAKGKPAVFLPSDTSLAVAMVKPSLMEDEAVAEFMKKLGLVLPDLCAEVILTVLPSYGNGKLVSEEIHAKHLSVISGALGLTKSSSYDEMFSQLRGTPWVRCRTGDGTAGRVWCCPGDAYFQTEELTNYFQGNPSGLLLDETDETINWKSLGVRGQPEVKSKGLLRHRETPFGYVILRSEWGNHRRGVECFDPATEVVGLEHALCSINHKKAAYIWNVVLPPLVHFIRGRYEHATRQTFDNAKTYVCDSVMGKLVKEAAWLPDSDGRFRTPSDCCVSEMHQELRRNEALESALGIRPAPGEVERKEHATKQKLVALAGFSEDVAAALVKNREEITVELVEQMIRWQRESTDRPPAFPEKPVDNPDRRGARVVERLQEPQPKVFGERTRRVRVTGPRSADPKVWLKEMYENSDGVLVCQMCRNAMPFRLPDEGPYHFEHVQISDDLDREEHTAYLALCPECAAKYRHLVKYDSDRVSWFIRSILSADELSVQAEGAYGPLTVSFVEKHLHDLQIALPVCESRDDCIEPSEPSEPGGQGEQQNAPPP